MPASTRCCRTPSTRGWCPNVVAMAADADGPIYEGAAGPRAVGESDPVTPDTQFRIASMTKMVATTAALQQVERGNLDLDAPVEQYLPEFADLQVLEGFDGDTPRLRPPAAKATVRQLASHTSGLSYWFWNADIVRWEEVTGHAARDVRLERDLHRPAGRRPGRPSSSTASTRTGSAASSRRRAASRSTPTSPSTSSGRWGWTRRRS